MKKYFDKNIAYFIIIAGAISPFGFVPNGYFPLIFIGYFVLFYSFYIAGSAKKAFFYGFIFGLIHFLVGFYWLFSIMSGYGTRDKFFVFLIIIGIILIISIEFGFLGFFSNIIKLKNRYFTFWITIYLPFLATIFEYFRGVIFTGLTWYTPANAVFKLGLSPLLPLGGTILVNYIFFLFIAVFVHLLICRKQNILYIASLISMIIISTFMAKNIHYTKPLHGKEIKIHIINSNFTKKDKKLRYKTIERVKKFTYFSLLEPKADLNIWPESTISADFSTISSHIENELKNLRDQNATVLTGAYVKYNNHTYNAIFSLADEKIVYCKQHLMPFGEYMPKWLSAFKYFLPTMFMDNLSKAEKFKGNIKFKDLIISPSICYEILFPNELRTRTMQSNLLLHISDLGWFDQTWAESYLLEEAKMRALESQKPMIYAVNSGISAIINKNGKILKKAKNSLKKNIYFGIMPQKGYTIYTKYGNKIVFIYLFVVLILFFSINRSCKCLGI